MAVFVEALDKCFENVCELDLIFHSDKVCIQVARTFGGVLLLSYSCCWCGSGHDFIGQVHYILDEIIMGGMVLETNIQNILLAVNDMNKLDAASKKMAL